MTLSYTIVTKQIDNQVQATVQEIGTTVTTSTKHDALVEARRMIHLAMVEEHQKQKREAKEQIDGR